MGQQQILPIFDFSDAVNCYAEREAEERGAVFTRPEVVEFILDLSGYTVNHPLHCYRLLEPSFGGGDFLIPVVDRLLTSYKAHVKNFFRIIADLSGAIRAVEVHRESIKTTRVKLLELLLGHGVNENDAHLLLTEWLIAGDFLLEELPDNFTHAVGNPPYVRQEEIPGVLMDVYRARYHTIYDRADLYVPFIERCLTSLVPGGVLGFICADRWMKNKYGAALRALVAKQYHLKYYVDMVDTPAFFNEVAAYPAITIIQREKPGPTRIAQRPGINGDSLKRLARSMQAESLSKEMEVVEVTGIVKGNEPWVLQSFDQLKVVRRLEADFPLMKEVGCNVGIGVATGADKVYIGPFDTLEVEPECKLPLVRTRDISNGTINWHGDGVINPFSADGTLVNLGNYPKLARYLEKHSGKIRNRNCAKKNPGSWYRTIDRIYPELVKRPKLLIPDIKGEALVVYDDGNFYPHHNLYYITSGEWDLKALQAVLQSGIARLFVSTYSPRMRGGYLRFQAQYLRRIRLPYWKDVPGRLRETLANTAAESTEARNRAVYELFRLTPHEQEIVTTLAGHVAAEAARNDL